MRNLFHLRIFLILSCNALPGKQRCIISFGGSINIRLFCLLQPQTESFSSLLKSMLKRTKKDIIFKSIFNNFTIFQIINRLFYNNQFIFAGIFLCELSPNSLNFSTQPYHHQLLFCLHLWFVLMMRSTRTIINYACILISFQPRPTGFSFKWLSFPNYLQSLDKSIFIFHENKLISVSISLCWVVILMNQIENFSELAVNSQKYIIFYLWLLKICGLRHLQIYL